MRFVKFLNEDVIKTALNIDEPETGKKYSDDRIAVRKKTLEKALKAADKKKFANDDAREAIMADLQDKLDKWSSVDKETAAPKPVAPPAEGPPEDDQAAADAEAEDAEADDAKAKEKEGQEIDKEKEKEDKEIDKEKDKEEKEKEKEKKKQNQQKKESRLIKSKIYLKY